MWRITSKHKLKGCFSEGSTETEARHVLVHNQFSGAAQVRDREPIRKVAVANRHGIGTE
jgi:hypothetical protein